MKDSPYIVRSEKVRLDEGYAQWLAELKQRYRNSQLKAAIKVNSEKLFWNWQMGRDLVTRKAETRWGEGIVEQVSLDLQAAFPDERGFSASNLWYMKRWYLFYAQHGDCKRLDRIGQEIISSENEQLIKLDQVGQVISDTTNEGLPFPMLFAYIPWRHHVEIVKKCKTVDEAFYYIRRTIKGDWSRNYLMERLKERDYHNQSIWILNIKL